MITSTYLNVNHCSIHEFHFKLLKGVYIESTNNKANHDVPCLCMFYFVTIYSYVCWNAQCVHTRCT